MNILNHRLFLIFIAAMFCLQITSCKKDDTPKPGTHIIQGLWIGLYSVDGHPETTPEYFSFVIKPDGTIINDTKALNQQHLNIGTWTLAGDSSFSCTTTCVYGLPNNIGVVENHTAKFSKSAGTLSNGVWKNVPPLNGSGTFTLTKVE